MTVADFFNAIRSGDFNTVISLLNGNPSLASATNDSGVSAILFSVYTGRADIRELLLSKISALSLTDAAATGNLARVIELVEASPSLASSYSPDGFPVVALASVFNHFDIVRFLAENGADLNAVATNGTGYNALTGAVASGHTQVVQWLLEHGSNPNYRYAKGYSCFLTAAANGHLEILRLLLSHCADPHAIMDDGKSALDLATERNHPAVVEFLRNLPRA